MLIDALKDDLDLILKHKGICIIGSGIGASTLAIELYNADISFVIIEAGSLRGHSNVVEKEHVGIPFGLRQTTSIEVGGTSNLWSGVLAPLDAIDFEKRDWVSCSGWPIQYRHLEPYYQRAGRMLGLTDDDLFNPDTLPANVKSLLADLPFDRTVLKNKLFQQPSPPVAFKYTLKRMTDHSDRFHCCFNLCVLELVKNSTGGIKKFIAGKSNGDCIEVYAKTFIVCSGALETPRLLLNSRMRNKNIGRFLMDHPMGNLCHVSLKEKQKAPIYAGVQLTRTLKIKSGLVFNEEIQKKHQLPNHCFYVRSSFSKGIDDRNRTEKFRESFMRLRAGSVSFEDMWLLIKNLDLFLPILARKLSVNLLFRYSDLFFVTEQTPNANSMVTLSEQNDRFGYPMAKVDWQLTKGDFCAMDRIFTMLKDQVFPKRHYQFTHDLQDLAWEKTLTSAAHHLGTARMADSPDNGVVDKNLKVFGTDNLYICDGSVFPTSGNANSGLTIAALACRLADYLSDKRL